MAAEVRYMTGPRIERQSGPQRGEALMWVRVGQSDALRPVSLTNSQLIHLAASCLEVLRQREAGQS